MSVGPHAERFNIVGNDHGHAEMCDFSVLCQKYPFWANLVQKIKTVSLSLNLLLRLIHIYRVEQ